MEQTDRSGLLCMHAVSLQHAVVTLQLHEHSSPGSDEARDEVGASLLPNPGSKAGPAIGCKRLLRRCNCKAVLRPGR